MSLRPRSLLFRSWFAVAAVLAIGGSLSYLTYDRARAHEQVALEDEVRERASLEAPLILATAEQLPGALQEVAGLFAFQPNADAVQFRRHAIAALDRSPALQRIAWVPQVVDAMKADYESRARATGSREFTIQGPGPELTDAVGYLPWRFVEPAHTGFAAGRDARSVALQPAFARASTHTGASVGPAGTGVAESTAGVFTLIQPVYLGALHTTADARIATGYIVAEVSASKLISQARQSYTAVTELLLVDTTPGLPRESRVLAYVTPTGASSHAPAEEDFRSTYHVELPLEFGGREWLLIARLDPLYILTARTVYPPIVLGGGILLTLLVAAYLAGALHRGELVQKEVEERTTELRRVKKALEEDVDRRQETESLLRQRQHQLNALMENSPTAIFIKDGDGRYVMVNRRFAEMHRRNREHFVGRSDFDLFPPDIASRLRLSDTRVLSSGRPIELEESFQLSDGPHTSIIQKFPLLDEEGAVQGLCGISTDITERKRAEAELRESRRQLESLLGQLPGMAFRFVNDGAFTPVYVSRGALTLTGHSARDFIEGVIKFDEIVHPEDRERFRSAITTAVKRRRGFEVEYRIIDRAGQVKWVFERGQGIYDEDGKLLSIEGLAIDITQRKDAEAEKLIVERRLLEGQKLESIGVLAGGIAHDFNNLLTGIIGNANLAALELPPTSRLQQNLKQIEIASQRAAELCQQMLAYAGKGRFMVHRVELGSLVENTVPLLRASISKRAQLRFELAQGLPPVLADPTQMRQIIMNLVINASEALGESDGEIAITTRVIHPTPDYFGGAVLAPAETDADFVVLQVRDTGCGMGGETIARIFDPFFTTKFAGRGLGLAAVLGIIRSHKGGITVTSTPGKGSTFTLFFPPASGANEAAAARKGTSPPWKQEGLALVIDDEDHVRGVTAGMLKSCGLRAETARDGYEGLDLFRARPQDFDIVLLDMTMPRLSGEETLTLLREVRPDVRVVFMSGYNRREVVDSLAAGGPLSFIQKPFTLDLLRDQLRQIMA